MSAYADRELLARVASALTEEFPGLPTSRALAAAVQCIADLERAAQAENADAVVRIDEPSEDVLVDLARRRLGR